MTDIPAQMTAVAISAAGGPQVLQVVSMDTPRPGAGQILVAVDHAGVNRPDVLQRKGLYPAPAGHSPLPGLEIAGRVAALGAGCKRYKIGDAVMALVNGGGYASYCVADEVAALPVPSGLSMAEAAAVPETFFTVWHNVFERGALKPGEWFLVHGGSSGIGTTAIQLAKAFGAKVVTTAGSVDKCQACVELGADRAINYREEDFAEVVKSVTGGRGVDVILDMVGGDYIARNIRSAADDGRIVQIAFLQGSKVEVDFMRVMLKRLTITGSTLRARTTEVKGQIASALERSVIPLLAAGKVRPVIDTVLPLAEAAKAHELMEASSHIGKIVLKVG